MLVKKAVEIAGEAATTGGAEIAGEKADGGAESAAELQAEERNPTFRVIN